MAKDDPKSPYPYGEPPAGLAPTGAILTDFQEAAVSTVEEISQELIQRRDLLAPTLADKSIDATREAALRWATELYRANEEIGTNRVGVDELVDNLQAGIDGDGLRELLAEESISVTETAEVVEAMGVTLRQPKRRHHP